MVEDSLTISGMFLLGPSNGPRTEEKIPQRNRENTGQQRKKSGRTSRNWETPRFKSAPVHRSTWAELKGGGGKTYRKAKPREDGPLETMFGDPLKTVFKGSPGPVGKILGNSKGLSFEK